MTTIVATAAAFSGAFEINRVQISIWTYLDAVLLLCMTVGLYFRSRLAGIAIGLYFFWSKHATLAQGDQNPVEAWFSYASGIIFLYFYLHAARAGIFLIRHDLKIAEQVSSPKGNRSEPPTLPKRTI